MASRLRRRSRTTAVSPLVSKTTPAAHLATSTANTTTSARLATKAEEAELGRAPPAEEPRKRVEEEMEKENRKMR